VKGERERWRGRKGWRERGRRKLTTSSPGFETANGAGGWVAHCVGGGGFEVLKREKRREGEGKVKEGVSSTTSFLPISYVSRPSSFFF